MEKDQPIECPSCKLLKEQIENQREQLQRRSEQLEKQAEQLQRQSEQLEKQAEQLQRQSEQIRKLEERLGLNSQNSSKPPSSDQKKNKQAPRGGAKKGHRGHFRQRFPEEQITHRVRSEVTQCEHCGCQELEEKSPWTMQQVELPEIRPMVTRIERARASCTHCGRRLIAPFPEGYDRTAFGPRLTSLVGLCSSAYRMSKRTIQELLHAVCNLSISLGSIPAMERRVSRGLEPAYQTLARRTVSQVAYVDETSFRQSAKTHYVWTVTTQNECFFKILPTRSICSLEEVRPRGHPMMTITDRYQVYAYPQHQYCLAHIQRDFKRFAQGEDHRLATRALHQLHGMFAASHLPRKQMLSRVRYRKSRLEEILYDIMANGSERFYRFAERLLDHFPKLFAFTRYPGVECTNNAAERSLRHIVLWRKTSYGTQSAEGSRFLERAISVWMTLKKQKKPTWAFFEQAYRSVFQREILTPNL